MGFGVGPSVGRGGVWMTSRRKLARGGSPICWTGQTVSTLEIPDVPIAVLYEQYGDLTRMVEWSPSLESVTVRPDRPSNSGPFLGQPRRRHACLAYTRNELLQAAGLALQRRLLAKTTREKNAQCLGSSSRLGSVGHACAARTAGSFATVSYTHLTLPTICSV